MTSAERHEARYQRRKAKRLAKRRAYLDQFDNFDCITDFSALIRANWEARRGVLWKASVMRYNTNFIRNALRARDMLRSGQDTRQGFYNFRIMERGKIRDVHSLHYAERVIRRSACTNALVPILARNLIYDNGASLADKGTGFAIKRVETMLHRYWRKHGNEGYVLVIDFRKYFDNIRHEPLKRIYADRLHDEKLRRLAEGFFECCGDKGLYIGPEDSQIAAIAFPNHIDHLIKDQWRIPYYCRYMDDSIIIMRDKKELEGIRDKLLSAFEECGIVINPKKTQIIKLKRGFTFLKVQFYLQDNGRLVKKPDRKNTVRQRRKLKAFKRFYDKGEMTLDQILTGYMSWRGCLLNKHAHKTLLSMDNLFIRLFNVSPWIKKKKGWNYHDGKRKNPEGPSPYQCLQVPAC